jgi:hypothetical protein
MQLPNMTRRFICRNCQRETNHLPIAKGQVHGNATPLEGAAISHQIVQVVQCRECDSPTCCIDTRIHPGHLRGDSYTHSTLYHPPLPFRLKPEWYHELPECYRHILDEVYQALDNALFFLASTGMRTALDLLIVEKIGDIGRFKDKIGRLYSEGMIDSDEQDVLLAVIDAGSASTHRSYRPDDEAINRMMDILEEFFRKMIVAPSRKQDLAAKAKALRKTTPKKDKPNKS